jgi:hypothetical protein
MDARVLLFAMAIAIFTGVLFGLAPAMQVTSPKLASVMKDGGRGASSGGSRRRLRDLLVIAEVSLAFILLVGSGLMMRTFFGLMNAESGFDATNTVTVPVPIALKRFPDPKQLNAYLHEIRTAVRPCREWSRPRFPALLPCRDRVTECPCRWPAGPWRTSPSATEDSTRS